MNNISTEALIKINTYSKYKDGWHYGEGKAFTKEVIRGVKEIYNICYSHKLSIIDVFPGLEGQIRITAYEKSYYVEIDINNKGNISYKAERNDIEIKYTPKITIKQLHKELDKIKESPGKRTGIKRYNK